MLCIFVFFCKQKPAYELRISDWSSDVCSSDLFALAIGILGGALYYFGTPSWAVNVGLIPDNAEPDLLLDMPRQPERRQLPSGDEYFAFSGSIVNASDQPQTVTPIIVQMCEEPDRQVFGWTIRPQVQELGTGALASFSILPNTIPQQTHTPPLTSTPQ